MGSSQQLDCWALKITSPQRHESEGEDCSKLFCWSHKSAHHKPLTFSSLTLLADTRNCGSSLGSSPRPSQCAHVFPPPEPPFLTGIGHVKATSHHLSAVKKQQACPEHWYFESSGEEGRDMRDITELLRTPVQAFPVKGKPSHSWLCIWTPDLLRAGVSASEEAQKADLLSAQQTLW